MDITLQDQLVGREVDGRYLVESRIARGGMATVYRALDRRLDREIALKVMHRNLAADDEFVSRFVREARAAARLSHPNVVQVFDQGSDNTTLYLAMEYLPGRTLRDVLRERGALTPRECVSVLEPVLGALGAAHRAGIVHRDVKPENVILTDDGRIKVADFGLAGAIAGPITTSADGELIGTVAYLSPELVSRGVADARADVYAAGIMLLELLTGKQPFSGSDPLQVAYRHVHESVPAPTALAPELTTAFDDLVLLCTSHDPDLRPSNANALLAELHDALSRVPEADLDRRAHDATALRMDAPTQTFVAVQAPVPGAPAAAAGPQPTSVLAVPRRSARDTRSGAQLVPRLSVHDDEPAPPGFLGDRRRQTVAALISVVVVVSMIFGSVWWFTGGPGAYTDTPDLVGVTTAEAADALAAKGLTPVERQVFSDDVANGQVISTQPAAGESVRKDGTVTLQISKGPELTEVPPLEGKSRGDAASELEDARLELGEVTEQFSDEVDEGDVISSSPTAGSKVAPDRKVNLVISKGIEPVTLDNVIGQSRDQAIQTLEAKGLKVEIIEQDFFNGGPPPNTVVAQDPAVRSEGQTVAKDATIRLTVTKDAPDQIFVPDLRGQNFNEARQALEALGLRVRREGGGFFQNRVREQSAQGFVEANTEVTLFLDN